MRPSFQVLYKYYQKGKCDVHSELLQITTPFFIVSSNQHFQYEIVLKTAEINMQVHAVSSTHLVYSLCVGLIKSNKTVTEFAVLNPNNVEGYPVFSVLYSLSGLLLRLTSFSHLPQIYNIDERM